MYPFERDAEVTEAGGSILAYQEYLATRDAAKLEAIADYNADDCRSTQGLRDWLLAERGNVGYLDAAPPSPPSAAAARPPRGGRAAGGRAARGRRATPAGGCSPTCSSTTGARRGRSGGRTSTGSGAPPRELRDDDAEAIGDLVPADDVPLGEVAQSYLHPLRFPPQQHKLSPGIAVDPVTQRGYEIPRIDDDAGLVWLKRGKASLYKPLPTALIPPKPIPQTAQQAALRALAEQATGQISGPSAAFELLLRMPPRLRGDSLGERVAQPRRLGAVHPGPARLGQDLHGRAADLRAARRRASGSASRRPRTRRSPTCSTRSSARRPRPASTFRGLKKSGGGNPESHYESAHVALLRRRGRVPARATT